VVSLVMFTSIVPVVWPAAIWIAAPPASAV
jgi:hypothetical protein